MNKEMLFFIEAVANEKNLSKADVIEAVESALASAIRKTFNHPALIRVELDSSTGDYKVFRMWKVVDLDNMPEIEEDGELFPESFDVDTMVDLPTALEDDPAVEAGDNLEEPIEAKAFGRISAQTAKQVIFQKLREYTRRRIAQQYENRIGEIFHATIKRIDRGKIFLDLGENIEGLMPRPHQISNEKYAVGKRIRAYLYEVGIDSRAPQLYFSRTVPALLEELFKLEVPEIADGVIDVKGVAREPGERAKIAVFTGDPHLDPVGSCVGVRGARVHAVTNELSGERVDIVIWDSNPAQFVMNALAPAEILSISVDEDRRSMDIAVTDELLAQAIGRSGQNVRLASELTGWDLNVMSQEDMDAKLNQQQKGLVNKFVDSLEITLEQAQALIDARITSIEEVAFIPENELLAINLFDESLIQHIRSKANDAMLLDLLDDSGEVSGIEDGSGSTEVNDIKIDDTAGDDISAESEQEVEASTENDDVSAESELETEASTENDDVSAESELETEASTENDDVSAESELETEAETESSSPDDKTK